MSRGEYPLELRGLVSSSGAARDFDFEGELVETAPVRGLVPAALEAGAPLGLWLGTAPFGLCRITLEAGRDAPDIGDIG